MKNRKEKLVLKISAAIFALFVLLALCADYLFSGPHYNSCGELIPIQVMIDLKKERNVADCDFIVVDNYTYLMTLTFPLEESKLKINYIRDIVFKKNEKKNRVLPFRMGAPISFEYIVLDQNDEIVHSGVAVDLKETSFGARNTDANFSRVALRPGKYKLKIDNLKTSAELKQLKSAIVIKYDLIK